MAADQRTTSEHGHDRLEFGTGCVMAEKPRNDDCREAGRKEPHNVPSLMALKATNSGNNRRGHKDDRKDRVQPGMNRLPNGPHWCHREYNREQEAMENAEAGQADANPVPK